MTIVDIGTDPANPKIVANLPLMNSIFGPPTNLAITPNGQLALVANSIDTGPTAPAGKRRPDNKLYVIDLDDQPAATDRDGRRWSSNRPACRSIARATSR